MELGGRQGPCVLYHCPCVCHASGATVCSSSRAHLWIHGALAKPVVGRVAVDDDTHGAVCLCVLNLVATEDAAIAHLQQTDSQQHTCGYISEGTRAEQDVCVSVCVQQSWVPMQWSLPR